MSQASSLFAAEPIGSTEPVGTDLHTPDCHQDSPVSDAAGLSTDYLNHYSEVLMLIEMATCDRAVVAELSPWQPVGYRAYFEASPLRRASAAIAAYDGLADWHRTAFEQVVQAMDKLALAAILALQSPYHVQTVTLVSEVISPAIRRLIDRAAAFLNSNGLSVADDTEQEAQAMVDRLIDHA